MGNDLTLSGIIQNPHRLGVCCFYPSLGQAQTKVTFLLLYILIHPGRESYLQIRAGPTPRSAVTTASKLGSDQGQTLAQPARVI